MREVGLLGLVILLAGCSAPVNQQAATPIVVPKGAPVALVLAKQLNAGEAKEGEFVPLLVFEDVKIAGRTAIPKGTLAEGEVTWSRSEGTLSGLVNTPARLEIKLK